MYLCRDEIEVFMDVHAIGQVCYVYLYFLIYFFILNYYSCLPSRHFMNVDVCTTFLYRSRSFKVVNVLQPRNRTNFM